MLPFSSLVDAAGATPADCIETYNLVATGSPRPHHFVGLSLPDHSTNGPNDGTKVPTLADEVSADMDRHIADMAAKAVQARGASIYIARMVKAIRLQIAAARHLDEGVDFFQAQGIAAARRADA